MAEYRNYFQHADDHGSTSAEPHHQWQHEWQHHHHHHHHHHEDGGDFGSQSNMGDPSTHGLGTQAPASESAWHMPSGEGHPSIDQLLFNFLTGESGVTLGGRAPILVIDHLDIINNTQSNTSQVFLDAANGGTIDIGGNVNALASQQTLIDHTAPPADLHFA